ncbi:hypothetical protein K435DRAFT_654173 [Dendrothele bispora CBS 962.96]|uniref:Cytochrome b2 n=1 Tax=Dendrothele bispora (strain CBS 962.96) TaxID=1314807 RepID=A0A4S8MHA8_DENBC|nr:hypothetical protein K435DRAFT_654173 [Dendrothele bispora CBS 962.96]
MPLTLQQVSENNTRGSCWVIINNHVYDVTEFLGRHPGGSSIILKYAGRDATAAYEPIHPADALNKHLHPSCHLGPVDHASAEQLDSESRNRRKTQDELRVEKALKRRPPLERMLSLKDLENVARQVLPLKTLSFYSSGADDEVALAQNALAYSRFFFTPRVLRPVSLCDPSTKILGFPSPLPIYVSAAALAKLGHPLGEINITKACGKFKHGGPIIQMVATNRNSRGGGGGNAGNAAQQTLFFQLYKPAKVSDARALVEQVEVLGYKAIFLTVDAAVIGNRERDVKSVFALEDQEVEGEEDQDDGPDKVGEDYFVESEVQEEDNVNYLGTSTASVLNDDRDMTWDVVKWLRGVTKLPIVLKGIQSVEDAILAKEAGVDGIVLSNHGGRQLEYSIPPIELLYHIRTTHPSLLSPSPNPSHPTQRPFEIYIDGGLTRGTSILKAIALGATAAGLGRPFLYALSAYGESGVTKLLEILHREIVTGMRLLGVSSIEELRRMGPELVKRVDWESETMRIRERGERARL